MSTIPTLYYIISNVSLKIKMRHYGQSYEPRATGLLGCEFRSIEFESLSKRILAKNVVKYIMCMALSLL